MKPAVVLLLTGLALLVGYEIYATLSQEVPTISQWVWRFVDRYTAGAFVCGLGFGLLLGHLFFPRTIRQGGSA